MSHKPFFYRLKLHLKQFLMLLAKKLFQRVHRTTPQLKDRELGLNLIGYYRGDLGLGDALRYITKAIEKANIPFLVRRLNTRLIKSQNNSLLNPYVSRYCKYPINCITINPDTLYLLPLWVNYTEWAKKYNVAYWFWELENFPQEWRYVLPIIDEIWVNTEFVATAMRQAHSRVIKIPFAIEFEKPSVQLSREYFRLPEQGFLFLTVFDFQSAVARKNPQAVIKAFLSAFRKNDSNAFLILKSINGHLHAQAFAELKSIANNDSRILFIDEQFSSEEVRGLMQCADCYVSLHRSEGLGLGMAESMYLGKPVIATAYSGNLEFMNAQTACLIPYQEIAVGPNEYLFSTQQKWADPDIQEAATAMQKMCSDRDYRNQLGNNAQIYMHQFHSFAVMGKAISQRLEQLSLVDS
jgi:glycosyltransferase involved in cell wall biosynthesis